MVVICAMIKMWLLSGLMVFAGIFFGFAGIALKNCRGAKRKMPIIEWMSNEETRAYAKKLLEELSEIANQKAGEKKV